MDELREPEVEEVDPTYGKGLDVEVATVVVGLEVRRRVVPSALTGRPTYVFDYLEERTGRWLPVKGYSTDLGPAMRDVVPNLRARGMYVSLHTTDDKDWPWRVTIDDLESRKWTEVNGGSLPWAISTAAIDAVRRLAATA